MSVNSKIKVDEITSYDPPNQAVQLTQGATVPNGQTVTINGNMNLGTGTINTGAISGTNITASGTVTASSFSGDATNITALPVTSISKSVAHIFIL
jgi:hypothetical protein